MKKMYYFLLPGFILIGLAVLVLDLDLSIETKDLSLDLPIESNEWNCYSIESGQGCKCEGNSSGGNGSCLSEDPLFYTVGVDATNQTASHCRAFAACLVGFKDCNGGPVTGGCIAKEGYVRCNNLPPEECII